MNILVVTHSFAPALSPRAIRWQRVIDTLLASGHQIDVVCGRAPGSLACEAAGELTIHRCGGGLLERIRGRLKPSVATGTPSESKRSWVQRAVSWSHDRIWKRLYWPDYACLWFPAAVHLAARLIRAKNHDVMISVSPPFTSHLVALWLRWRFPSLRWLVDIGDPFALLEDAELNNTALYRSANLGIERAVVNRCDALSVTTAATARLYAEGFGVEPAKFTVVPPIVRPSGGHHPAPAESERNDVIRALYAGTFYERIREPDAMIALLEAALESDQELARRFELEVFGDITPFRARFERARRLIAVTRFHGAVPPAELALKLATADVLINVGNTTHYQLPSKIVEYMAECKPILNVCSIANDSSAQLLASYPVALSTTATGRSADIGTVAAFLRNAPSVAIDPAAVAAIVQQFRPERVAAQYQMILDSLLSGAAGRLAKDAS